MTLTETFPVLIADPQFVRIQLGICDVEDALNPVSAPLMRRYFSTILRFSTIRTPWWPGCSVRTQNTAADVLI